MPWVRRRRYPYRRPYQKRTKWTRRNYGQTVVPVYKNRILDKREVKWFRYNPGNYYQIPFDGAGIGTNLFLSPMRFLNQGTDSNNRIGAKITLLRIEFRAFIYIQDSSRYEGYPNNYLYRYRILRNYGAVNRIHGSQSALNYIELLEDDRNSYINKTYAWKIGVIKCLQPGYNGSNEWTTNDYVDHWQQIKWTKNFKGGLQITFNANANQEPVTNCIQMSLAVMTTATWTNPNIITPINAKISHTAMFYYYGV